jgi:CheY-like chemotaxis protein/anti-sigma regulatory factor (Ser/Thr protein kinase)
MREFYRQREEAEPVAPVNVNEVVRQVVDLTSPRWKDMVQEQGRVVTIETELESDLPTVPGIATELREALTNLVLNAVDAMPQGGTIRFRTRVTGSAVTVEVSDTGTGMDEATRERCLEPFFSTKGEHGTGLGLAMVYGIAKRHEADLEIDSEPGRGTTVRLLLPRSRGVEPMDAAALRATAPSRPLSVLCIDDEAPVRESVRILLEVGGHRVQATPGGQAGLDAFRAAQATGTPFDVVVTDLGMPHVDGRQVARAVKAESATPVILLTGWGARDDIGGAGSDVDLTVGKPVRLDVLQAALARVTGGTGVAHPA